MQLGLWSVLFFGSSKFAADQRRSTCITPSLMSPHRRPTASDARKPVQATQQHQHLVHGVNQRVYDPHRVGRRHDHWLIVRLHSLETPTTCGIGEGKLLEHSECEDSTHRVLDLLHRLAA